jgi:hypothetical protein
MTARDPNEIRELIDTNLDVVTGGSFAVTSLTSSTSNARPDHQPRDQPCRSSPAGRSLTRSAVWRASASSKSRAQPARRQRDRQLI